MPKMADAVDGLARTDCSSCIQFDAARRSGPVETTVTTWSRPVAYSVGGGGGEVPNELKRRPLLLVVVYWVYSVAAVRMAARAPNRSQCT